MNEEYSDIIPECVEDMPVEENTAPQTPEEILQFAKDHIKGLAPLWEKISRGYLLHKQIEIKTVFPFKRISSFIIIKQSTLSFKDGDENVEWKLHIQLLASSKIMRGDLGVRFIWSKNGKYLYKMTPLINPEVMDMFSRLAETFGYTKRNADAIVLPFYVPVKDNRLENLMSRFDSLVETLSANGNLLLKEASNESP